MIKNIYMVTTWPPEKCGIGMFSQNLANSIGPRVGSIKVAPIDDKSRSKTYNYPAINEWKIDKSDQKSWVKVANEISKDSLENDDSAVILQHEYGLDPREDGAYGLGKNFVKISEIFNKSGVTHFAYLHTVKQHPDEHQKQVLQELAKTSNGLIVTAEKAIDILRGPPYNISEGKIEHIDHGTRNFVYEGRDEVKRKHEIEGVLVRTTLGMKGERKGLEQTISAEGEFLNNRLPQKYREELVWIIAGGYHPNAVKNGEDKQYDKILENKMKENNLKWVLTKEPNELGKLARKNDIIILEPPTKDGSLSEELWMDLYTMTNCMYLWYPRLDQISSGILADTCGSGRTCITTKFPYALELLHPKVDENKKGILGMNDPRARGLSVDTGEEGIKQTVECLEYLFLGEEGVHRRTKIEKEARLRGYKMSWDSVGKDFLAYLEFVENTKEDIERAKEQKYGKDPIFIKE